MALFLISQMYIQNARHVAKFAKTPTYRPADGVSIWTVGFPFFIYSYGSHRIFGTFYALVVLLAYGTLGHLRVKWPDFPILHSMTTIWSSKMLLATDFNIHLVRDAGFI